MKFSPLFIAALCCALFSQAQDSESIVGKWVYKSIAGADTLEEQNVAIAEMMLGGSSHYFNAQGRYSMFAMDQRDVGDWKVEADGSVTVTSDKKGSSLSLGVPKINGNELTLKVGSGEVIYESGKANEDDRKIDNPEPVAGSGITAEQLVGKWKFKTVPGADTLDERSAGALQAFFGDMTYFFHENGRVRIISMGKEHLGDWTMKENDVLEIITDKGEIQNIPIQIPTEDELRLAIDDFVFILESTEASTEDMELTGPERIPALPLTMDQLCKKWFVTKYPSKNPDNKFVQEAGYELMRGSYMSFLPDGRYEGMVLGIEDKAKWNFEHKNTSVKVHSHAGKKVWYFVEVSEERLVMTQGISQEKVWEFSTTEPPKKKPTD